MSLATLVATKHAVVKRTLRIGDIATRLRLAAAGKAGCPHLHRLAAFIRDNMPGYEVAVVLPPDEYRAGALKRVTAFAPKFDVPPAPNGHYAGQRLIVRKDGKIVLDHVMRAFTHEEPDKLAEKTPAPSHSGSRNIRAVRWIVRELDSMKK